MKIFCPAKVNLFFNTLKKRLDSFHEIESVLHTVNLADLITLRKSKKFSLSFSKNSTIPPITADYDLTKNNFLEEIYLNFKRQYAISPVAMEIEKHIPVGAGLGGGSSNAAGCLLGLADLFHLDLKRSQLANLAASFGSDTPFFIEGGMAFASGRGELIETHPLSLNSPVVIVYPNLTISTKLAYQENNQLNPFLKPNLEQLKNQLTKLVISSSLSIDEKRKNSEETLLKSGYNSFQAKTILHYHEIQYAWSQLNFFQPSLLSGSGSSIFALFHDTISAGRAAGSLKKSFECTFKTKLISHGVRRVS